MVKHVRSKLAGHANDYFGFLEGWLEDLAYHEVKRPDQTAILVVDITNGFCNEGALASPRVKAIIRPIVALLKNAWNNGVREFYLLNDNHEPDALEFRAFPPHCIRGTAESKPVRELLDLEFFPYMQLIEKNTLSSTLETALLEVLHAKPSLTDFIIVGDCTDLCVYQLAMALRFDANARHAGDVSVIVPEDCVATYDMPVELAQHVGAAPHPGDVIHAVFSHHMALNGVSVVKSVRF